MSDLDTAIDTDDLASDEPVVADTRDLPLRYSVLKAMASSAAHARALALRDSDSKSLALRLGSAGHALTFGTPEVAVYRGKRRAGDEWLEFQEANAGKVIVNVKEHAHAEGMANAIRSNPVAARVLFEPRKPAIEFERRIDWEWDGRKWRSTPDAMWFRGLAELKTTRNANPAQFWRDAQKMHYHVQLAIYQRAIEQTTGVRPRDVYLFAVESAPPYVVTPFKLSDRSLEHGDMIARRWHEQFLRCEAENDWPGYTRDVAELDIYDAEVESELEVARAMASDDGTRAEVRF